MAERALIGLNVYGKMFAVCVAISVVSSVMDGFAYLLPVGILLAVVTVAIAMYQSDSGNGTGQSSHDQTDDRSDGEKDRRMETEAESSRY